MVNGDQNFENMAISSMATLAVVETKNKYVFPTLIFQWFAFSITKTVRDFRTHRGVLEKKSS